MTTWAGVGKGDAVMLKGNRYVITKHKRSGKRIRVEVVGSSGRFSTEVKAKDEVQLAPAENRPRERWATEKEAERVLGRMPQGDTTAIEPSPRGESGDPWETPRDRVERKLDTILGAHLVGEATDESAGYYVPPVDVTTAAAHLVLFHGEQRSDWDDGAGEGQLVARHGELHAQHLADPVGAPLKINHWHTKTRPEA